MRERTVFAPATRSKSPVAETEMFALLGFDTTDCAYHDDCSFPFTHNYHELMASPSASDAYTVSVTLGVEGETGETATLTAGA